MTPVRLRVWFSLLVAVTAVSQTADPRCDGQESIEQYGNRVGLPLTRTLELGTGVKLELVLIPAGTHLMGTPWPPMLDEGPLIMQAFEGQAVLTLSLGILLALLSAIAFKALRQKQRVQFSLAQLVILTVIAGTALLGGMHWHKSVHSLEDARRKSQAAAVRLKNAEKLEMPAHLVTFANPFYIGRYEVTQEQYQQMMGRNPSRFKGLDRPVEFVSWSDAKEFCDRISRKTGTRVTLPTEAEWEYACRAGTETTYCSGDEVGDLDRVAWFENNSRNSTQPVGSKMPNAWGLFDMHGNVWEWCEDLYRLGYKKDSELFGHCRVLRGGSWDGHLGYCRSAIRRSCEIGYRDATVGFRIVVSNRSVIPQSSPPSSPKPPPPSPPPTPKG